MSQHSGGTYHKERAARLSFLLKPHHEGHDLMGLSQPHIVAQAPAKAVFKEKMEPLDCSTLHKHGDARSFVARIREKGQAVPVELDLLKIVFKTAFSFWFDSGFLVSRKTFSYLS
jgi:hypothetical protein